MALTELLALFALLYSSELAFFAYAAFRSRHERRKNRDLHSLPKVSVVVAAKDEEKDLPDCLDSLVHLEYPRDNLEIIVVNDQSIDGTADVIDGVSQKFGFVKRLDAMESDELRGKTNALAQGIEKSTGDFVFLTDADCRVPATWITETLKYFDSQTGIVGGVTLISKIDNALYGIQAMDWDILLTIAAGAATMGHPVACLGNNLAVRKTAYEDVGGYRKIKFSVTEDFALFKAIAKSGKWRYCFPMDPQALVETLPVESLKEIFAQRKRWATGGKESELFGYLTLAAGFVFHWLTIVSLFVSLPLFISFFLLKGIIDFLFILPTLRNYGKIAHLKFILYFEIYYTLYVAILPLAVYFGKGIIWKGRRY